MSDEKFLWTKKISNKYYFCHTKLQLLYSFHRIRKLFVVFECRNFMFWWPYFHIINLFLKQIQQFDSQIISGFHLLLWAWFSFYFYVIQLLFLHFARSKNHFNLIVNVWTFGQKMAPKSVRIFSLKFFVAFKNIFFFTHWSVLPHSIKTHKNSPIKTWNNSLNLMMKVLLFHAQKKSQNKEFFSSSSFTCNGILISFFYSVYFFIRIHFQFIRKK